MDKQSTGGRDRGIMSLSQCAAHLHLSEKTVLKLASEGRLPGVLQGKTWRFQRSLIDEWLGEGITIADDEGIEEIPDGTRVPLDDLMPEAAVIGDLQSMDALGVIEELAARAYNQKWLKDKPWFVGALIEREALSSTAMEGGVAFLHTRAREASRIAYPFIVVGRSYSGVDFGAPDGRPTFLFFLLGLKHDKLHLPILGRLARSIRHPATVAKLRSQPSAAKMRALLLEEDAHARSGSRQIPVHYEDFKPKLDRLMRLRTIKRLNTMRQREEEKAQKAQKKAQKTKPRGKRADSGDKKAAATAAKKAAATKKVAGRAAKSAEQPTEKQAATKRKAAKSSTKKATPTPPAKKAPAKKAAAKTSPKKAAAKKAPAKKAQPAKKAPANKATAKKAPANKATAKKVASKPGQKASARKAASKRTAGEK